MLDESFYNQGCVNVDADLKEFKTSLQLHPHLREAIELALAIKRRVQVRFLHVPANMDPAH